MEYMSLHRIYFVELTVAFDTNLEEARDRKVSKYSHIPALCEESKWHATIHTVELGSRGFTDGVCSTYSDVLPDHPATTHWHFDLRYVVWLSVLPSQSGLEGTLNNGQTNLC